MRVETGRWAWMAQAASGVLLVLLVGLHWVAQHYIAVGGLRTYADVTAYLRHPLVFALETAFLIVVTTHAFLGVRAILLDLGLNPRVMRRVAVGLMLLGIATIGYGLDLTLAIIR